MDKIKLFFYKLKENAKAIFRMLYFYFKGEYKSVPTKTIAAILAFIIYMISPIDILPDLFPGIGLIDDLIVICLAYKFIKPDLNVFKKWYIANKTVLTEVEYAETHDASSSDEEE